MQQLPNDEDLQVDVDSIVTPGMDEGPHRPGELVLMPAGDTEYSIYHVCPRCLNLGRLGHQVQIQTGKVSVTKGDRRDGEAQGKLELNDALVDMLTEADSPKITVDPSIGCQNCGLHTWLEESTHDVLADWDGANHDGRDMYRNQARKMQDVRPEAWERLAEQGYPEPEEEGDG